MIFGTEDELKVGPKETACMFLYWPTMGFPMMGPQPLLLGKSGALECEAHE